MAHAIAQAIAQNRHGDHSWHIRTILPVTEAFSSNSCARGASRSGSRSATTGAMDFS